MEMVKLGKTDVEVTRIAFGAWAIGGWMWGGSDEKEARRALDASIDMGITSIDTAPVYGFGLSERIVGKAIQGKRDRVQILTKYGLRWDTGLGEFFFATRDLEGKDINVHRYAGRQSIIRECEESLRRLKTDYIDLYQIHWSDPSTPVEESMEVVNQLIRQGKVRAAGVSNYDVDEVKRADKVLDLASNQVPYSMLRRDIEDDIVPWCMDNNVGIMVYSPLQRGLLTGKIKPEHRFNEGDTRPDSHFYDPANIRRINKFLDSIRPLAETRDLSLAQLVLRWTLQQPGITCLLAGARNESQLSDNAGALSFELSESEMKSIGKKLKKLEPEIEA